MNLLILAPGEVGTLLSPADRRVSHVRKVLGKRVGDKLEAGLLTEGNAPAMGALGSARIERLDEEGMLLSYAGRDEPAPLPALTLLLGFPRPIQGKRLLRDLASLGVAEIVLTGTELGEKSYLESDLWKKDEWRLALIEGLEQAGNPRLPLVRREWTLDRAIAALGGAPGRRVVLHPEAGGGGELGGDEGGGPLLLAIGSERGWTERELAALAEAGFERRSLGARILKTETAAVAAVAVALSGLRRTAQAGPAFSTSFM